LRALVGASRGPYDARLHLLHEPTYSQDWGWRTRPIFGALGLRPAISQHHLDEGACLRRYAANRRSIVELGVAEGASAWELGQAMAPDGQLVLVDPYASLAGAARITARRLVNATARGNVRWVRQRSYDAVASWTEGIEFLFIDADHGFEGCLRDWNEWTPFVTPDGHVALHDASPVANWVSPADGPPRVVEQALERGWQTIETTVSLVVLSRSNTALPAG